MLPRQEVGDTCPQRRKDTPGLRWSCSGKTMASWSLLVETCSPPSRRHTCRMSWWAAAVVAAVVMLQVAPCCSLEARCPPQDRLDNYCQCYKEIVRSGTQINIKCDFQMKEDVSLTENLYPFGESKAIRASVRVVNATSLRVTQGFLGEWLKILSVGLDLWNCGTVSLASAPSIYFHFPHSFSTFVGLGVVGCRVPEVPPSLLRDRVTASLLIKRSVVGTMRRGVLQAVQKVRYIVLEDSVVEEIEGPLAAEGSFTLSHLDQHRWNGLILTNVTMRSLASGAFNLTHTATKRENTHKVVMKDCRVDRVGSGGITARGDVAVTIKNNSFGKLEDEALKISVSRDLKFEGNVVEAAGEGALRGLECQNFTKLDTNMIYMISERNVTELLGLSLNPFPASCTHSQIFRVVNLDLQQTRTVLSLNTWILLAILLLVMLAAIAILYRWRENNKLQKQTQNNFHSYNNITSTTRYQANQQEVNMVRDGESDALYDRTPL